VQIMTSYSRNLSTYGANDRNLYIGGEPNQPHLGT
jgi:hypothetical protein